MITDRWQADEELEEVGISTFEIVEPSCLHCKKRNKDNFASCEEYDEIPWEICVADKDCERMEK